MSKKPCKSRLLPKALTTYIYLAYTNRVRKRLITFTDAQDTVLAESINASELVRNALDVYIGHISTDTVTGLRQSYKELLNYMKKKHEYYDKVFNDLEKLISVLETRM